MVGRSCNGQILAIQYFTTSYIYWRRAACWALSSVVAWRYRSRGVVPGGAGGAMAPPDFGRSVNSISTRGDRLCPPNYYLHPRIFIPSDGPVLLKRGAVWSVLFCLLLKFRYFEKRRLQEFDPSSTYYLTLISEVKKVEDGPHFCGLLKSKFIALPPSCYQLEKCKYLLSG